MSDHPFISIIIPVYNTRNYLPECVESLLKQTLVPLEYIFVDNGSSDGSYEFLLSVQTENAGKDISVYRVEGGRQGRCRNFGIQKAKGTYIGFADSDDWCDLGMFEHLYSEALKYDADICFGRVIRADPTIGVEADHYGANYFKEGVYNEFEVPYLTRMTVSCNKIYRRSLLLDSNSVFLEGMIHEDVTFNYRALYSAEKVCSSEKAIYYWRQHANSSSKKLKNDDPMLQQDVFKMCIALRELELKALYDQKWRYSVNRTIDAHLSHRSNQYPNDQSRLEFIATALDVAGFLPFRLEKIGSAQCNVSSSSKLKSYIDAQKRFDDGSVNYKLDKYRARLRAVVIFASCSLIANVLMVVYYLK